MIVWGGRTNTDVDSDGAAYNPSTRQWRALPAAPLTGRSNPFMVWTGRQLLVWGGYAFNEEPLGDGAIYDPTSRRWTAMATAPSLRNKQYNNPARELIWAGNNAVLVALDKGSPATTGVAASFDPVTNNWRKLPPDPVTPVNNLAGVTAALVQGRLVVWISSGGAFTLNPAGTRWAPVPYAPKAAGCIFRVIPAGRSIIYPGDQQSVNCGGDAAYIPGVRGSDLDLTSGQVRRIPYTSTIDGNGAAVWTGAALLNADAGEVRNPYRLAKTENVAGATTTWNTAPRAGLRWPGLPPWTPPRPGCGQVPNFSDGAHSNRPATTSVDRLDWLSRRDRLITARRPLQRSPRQAARLRAIVLDSCFSSAASTSSLTSFDGEHVAHGVPGLGGGGAQGDQQVGLAGPGVTDQAERLACFHPAAAGELVDGGGGNVGVGGEVELVDAFVAGEPGGVHPPGRPAGVTVVALGHHQFGEKSQVGQLFPFGGGGDLTEAGTDGRQAGRGTRRRSRRPRPAR